MTETATDRLHAAWDELADQEDHIRSLRHLSDDELRAHLVGTLRKEKAGVARWLGSGDWVASRSWRLIWAISITHKEGAHDKRRA